MAIRNDKIAAAGDVVLDQVVIINSAGQELDIKLYVGELNLFEDMFSNGLYGNMLVIDNLNLTDKFGIVGDEYLRLKIFTPSMEGSAIYKTFKVYKITDKIFTNDTARQSYVLHFCSPEIFVDAYSPLYQTFEGGVDEVAQRIFEEHLAVTRVGDEKFSTMIILGNTVNNVKFTSPGWRPMKCLNWLASKAQCAGFNNPGYLFYESNKAFYFLNYEQLINSFSQTNTVSQTYFYSAAETTTGTSPYVNDVNRQYQTIMEFNVAQSFDGLKNSMTGYLANRLFTLDMVTKDFNVYEYNHIDNYNSYHHLEDRSGNRGSSRPPFTGPNILATPGGFHQVATKHFGLYTGFRNNVQDIAQDVKTRRTSTLHELQNFKIEITVPGRTDAEVGNVIQLYYPDSAPRDSSDKNNPVWDKLYSGRYLVTAIRHKFNLQRHVMTLEIIKDSFAKG